MATQQADGAALKAVGRHAKATHGGAVVSAAMPVKAGPGGIEVAAPVASVDGCKREPWQAKWIWLDPTIYPQSQKCSETAFAPRSADFLYTAALFRKVVTLADAATVRAYVSADTRYRLIVNGRVVGRGPAEVGGDYGNTQPANWWFYDSIDLSEYLIVGENVIVAEVLLGPRVEADYSMGRGGFLFEARGVDARGGAVTIVSDGSWLATRNAAWEEVNRYAGANEPTLWWTRAIDASQWQRAVEVADAIDGPWRLIPREIPPLMETRVLPNEVVFVGDVHRDRVSGIDEYLSDRGSLRVSPGCAVMFFLRFEREITAYSRMHVRGPAGATVTLQFHEVLGRTDRAANAETITLRDGEQEFDGLYLQGFTWVQVLVQFPGGITTTQPVEFVDLSATFTSFPVQYRGAFECSDAALNRTWDVCRWTNQICMQGYHLDSPIHQEALGCAGDYMIEAAISYVTFGETRLARQDILRCAYYFEQHDYRQFHTSYALLWVQMVWEYWQETADIATVRAVLPTLERVLQRFSGYIGRTGLVTESPDYMFMDWVMVDGFNMHHPPCVMGQGYLSAFLYRGLLTGAACCELIGETARATSYQSQAANLREAFERELWCGDRGLYCDGRPFVTQVKPGDWLPADVDKIYFSVQTNAAAVACGVVTGERAKSVLRKSLADVTLPMVQMYYMHFVFEAIEAAGLSDELACGLMREWTAIVDEHPTSLKESWTFGDYSHAWGGTPVIHLSTRVLGVQPAQAGWSKVRICPNCGDLTWAKGIVPTAKGDVAVSWRVDAKEFSIDVTLPTHVPVELVLPKRNAAKVSVVCDGKPMTIVEECATRVTVAITDGGTHSLVVTAV